MEILSYKKAKTNSKYGFIISLSLMIMFVAFSCTKCNQWLGLEDDHFVEELAESVIENQTGLSLDLSPETPE